MKRTFGARQETKLEGMLRPIYFPALTFMDVKTGDGRLLESAGGGTRELPLTIWAQFEQGPGGHVGAVIAGTLHELTFHDDGLVSGSGWVLELVESDGVTVLRVVDSAGAMTFEQPVDAATPTDFEVVLDNVTREYRARVGDEVVFLPAELSPMQPAAADGAPSALCVDLTRQL